VSLIKFVKWANSSLLQQTFFDFSCRFAANLLVVTADDRKMLSSAKHKVRYYYYTTTILWLSGLCPGQPGWAGTTRNIHPLTPIVVINHPLSASSIFYDPWHPPCSVYIPDSFSTISLQVFFGLHLGLAPSTLYAIHFFTQSLSSFCSTCPYHHNLFCCSTEIMSSNPSLSLNPLLGILSCSLVPHIHLTIVISAHWSATSFFFATGQVSLPCNILLRT